VCQNISNPLKHTYLWELVFPLLGNLPINKQINKKEREVLYRRKLATACSEDSTRSPPFSHHHHGTRGRCRKRGL